MGVSTRKVTASRCGLEISATSRPGCWTKSWKFRSRELGEYPIVYLDAHYKVRRGGRVQDVAILKAIGVNEEVLGLSPGSVKRRCIGEGFWEICTSVD